MADNFAVGKMTFRIAFSLLLLVSALMNLLSGCAKERPKAVEPSLVFGERGKKNGSFLNIDGIAVDARGQIYVADVHRVQVFNRDGKYVSSIGRKGSGAGEIGGDIVGIAVNSRNQIVVSDPANYRFLIFLLEGTFVRSFGERGTENGRFLAPQGVCTDREGRIYTVDNGADTVQVFSPDGAFLFRFGGTGSRKGQFREPESIAIHDEKIYVADEGNGRIQYFDLKGAYLGELGRRTTALRPSSRLEDDDDIPAESFKSVFTRDVEGIAFDGEGLLYAANEEEGVIEVFSAAGKRIGSFTSNARGGLKKIQGLAVNREKTSLYVCDQGNMRIQVFALSAIQKALSINAE